MPTHKKPWEYKAGCDCDRCDRHRQSQRVYAHSAKGKATKAAYNKTYLARPEVKAKAKAYGKAYRQKPEVKIKNLERQRTPESKAYRRARYLSQSQKGV